MDNLKKLIQINSKSDNIPGVNNFGNILRELYSELEIEWEIVKKKDAADFLIGRTKINKDKPVICFSAHMDVVFEPEKVEFKETEDKLFGSGVSDMKSSFIVILEVLKKLKEEEKLENIVLAFSPEEETATLNHRETIQKIAEESDYVLVFESTLNEGQNEPLNKRSVVASRRGFQHFDVIIEGPGGHSGLLIKKEERINTILIAANILTKLEALADYQKITTVNIGMINGGQAINVLAPVTQFFFEFRYKTEEEYKRVHGEIKKIFDPKNFPKKVNVKLNENKFYPNLENTSQDFVEICKEVAIEQNIDLIVEQRNGGSEASLFKFYNPKAQVLDGFGVRGYEEHTAHEYIFKETLNSTIEYVASIINRLNI